ncbi:hypothetical protein CVT26_011681 [Gymnopilus dilepis]|uniref:Uncharacterized protein n=1 Tax=Gymnopilus dilepis TaxID=231916 RepID=A0A409W8Z4_9AGAR|nr:hypothetical protein CVT26_011681 [Gymnopilus dilepis]
MVMLTITVLYALYMTDTGIDCYALDWQFIRNGESALTIFTAPIYFPLGPSLARDVAANLSAILADALMIWRCFQVWDRSLRVVAVPLILWGLEIAAAITAQVLLVSFGQFESVEQATAANAVSTALVFLVLATSALTTILIAYRIISLSKGTMNRTKFELILDIIVQSSSAYAILFLVIGVMNLVEVLSSSSNLGLAAAGSYIDPFATVVPGLSTTVMVARIARLPQDATFPMTTSVHVSNLQFRESQKEENTNDAPNIGGPSLLEMSVERGSLSWEKSMV